MRALRDASGLTGDSVARRASMSAGKLSKIENGKVRPTVQDVDLVLTAIGVSQEVKEEFLAAARAEATEATAWRLLRRMGPPTGTGAQAGTLAMAPWLLPSSLALSLRHRLDDLEEQSSVCGRRPAVRFLEYVKARRGVMFRAGQPREGRSRAGAGVNCLRQRFGPRGGRRERSEDDDG
ncbi:helix-turn-helix domain-containing protein [Streptomyces sp. NPDC006703]|uniref:helix-turn-helix domain-containing protein n=1 Tax=Streptomyces sp. NPDC006703 TaxID=3364759 RepID=UPI0036A88021